MPTQITSAGVTFTDTTTLTSANIGTAQLVNGSVTAEKLGTTEQRQIAKAWVNFNGTTSPGTIRSQYNVSSVTKNGTGDYTVNFATPMADANYSVTANAAGSSSSAGINSSITLFETSAGVTVAPTSSSFRFYIRAGNPPVISDSEYLCAIVFGN